MKIACISDMHNKLIQVPVPPCDVLVIAGDVTNMGTAPELIQFNRELGRAKNQAGIKTVVMIAGNHDWMFEENPARARSLIPEVDHYLEDSAVEIDGFKFYGSPWQPEFFSWAFNLKRGAQLKAKWDLIPAGLDVLITHGPPYGILDRTISSGRAGCVDLGMAVLDKSPRYHVFGHIHWSAGQTRFQNTTYINACSCDEMYRVTNPPIEFEL